MSLFYLFCFVFIFYCKISCVAKLLSEKLLAAKTFKRKYPTGLQDICFCHSAQSSRLQWWYCWLWQKRFNSLHQKAGASSATLTERRILRTLFLGQLRIKDFHGCVCLVEPKLPAVTLLKGNLVERVLASTLEKRDTKGGVTVIITRVFLRLWGPTT